MRSPMIFTFRLMLLGLWSKEGWEGWNIWHTQGNENTHAQCLFLACLPVFLRWVFSLRIRMYNMLAHMQFLTFDKFDGMQIVYQYAWKSTACIYKCLVWKPQGKRSLV
jgi:hypothetical protein